MHTDALDTHDVEALRRLAVEAWQRAEALQKQASRLAEENQALVGENQALARAKTKAEAQRDSLLTETEVLFKRIGELTAQLAEATERDKQLALDLELKVLRERLATCARDTYGSRTERRSRREKADKPRDKQKGHGPTAQPDLPIVPVLHELHGDDCACEGCGGDLRVLAEQFEESELITSVHRKFVLKHVKRQKYACKGCGAIVTAPGPLRLIPGGRYDVAFAVQVALDKYLDALPLERQVLRMRRRGLQITSQTLWDQLHALYLLLLPSFIALQARVLRQDVLHADETPWRQMGRGKSKRWWMWTLAADHVGVLFHILPSRGSEAAKAILHGFAGILVADGYVVYASLEKALSTRGEQLELDGEALPMPDFTLAMCWMHARRGLFNSEKDHPEAGEALDLIAELYAIEALAKERAAGDRDALLRHRRELRDARSRDVVRQIEVWCSAQRVLPGTRFANAIGFLTDRWTSLKVFLDDPRVPLDNGEAERQIRRPVLGRKNFYGTRSERGARVASLLFSLIGSCTLLGVDPFDYLVEAAERALRDPGSAYLPHEHPTISSRDHAPT